jgi:hypothetical protein
MLCSVSTQFVVLSSLYCDGMLSTNYVDTEHNIPSLYRELGTTNYVDTEHNIPSLYRELGTTNYVDTEHFCIQ